MVSLALEPAAIEAVLKELRTYIRNGDSNFVCVAIRAVGRIAELARIVYDRHGQTSGDVAKERKTANRLALDCLYGLSVVTQTCDSKLVIGEAIVVMQNILIMLPSDSGEVGSLPAVEDPNDVQGYALRRILLPLVNTLSQRGKDTRIDEDNEGSDDEDEEPSELEKVTVELPHRAVASALWMVGEWVSNISNAPMNVKSVDGGIKTQVRLEVIRLVDRAFPELAPMEKEQSDHLACKLLVSSATGAAPTNTNEAAICEHVMSMGRVDVNPVVKDRARFVTAIVKSAVGLKHDTDAIDALPSFGKSLSVEDAKKMLIDCKPSPSFLAVEDETAVDKSSFRFGTLSSLVGHQARGAYLPLPPWGETNSPKALRDPIEEVKEQVTPAAASPSQIGPTSGFYGDDSDSSGGSSSSSSSSSDGERADSESDSDDSSDDSSSSSDSRDDDDLNLLGSSKLAPAPSTFMQNNHTTNQNGNNLLGDNTLQPVSQPPLQSLVPTFPTTESSQVSSDDDSSSGSSSSDSSSDENYNGDISSANLLMSPREGNLLSMGGGMMAAKSDFAPILSVPNGGGSAMDKKTIIIFISMHHII